MSLLVSTTCIALVICSYYLYLFLVNFCLRIASSSQRDSASLPSTEPSPPQWKYDVFLSFRGEDTRKGIAFEIYDGLKNRGGIKTFMDKEDLQAGAPISPTLLKAIEESRFAIIVLSPNYASSPWCLEELRKIVECMKDEKEDENRILPLFYHVEPSDVRHQKNNFKVALAKLEATKRHDRETVKKWRYVLKTVANLSGWETKNFKTERELVEDIVKFVCNKVRSHLINEDYEKFDSRVSTLEKIMKELASSSTDMILVYGIGGVGKTTLAEEVLRQAQKQRLFDDTVMVRDVKFPNLEAIQNQIADKLGLPILNIQTVHGRADKINGRIKDKKSLVILDDVWGQIDLKAVGLPHIPTCRILLTSRSRQVFSIDSKQKDFPLGVLDQEEAWILFKKKAGDVVADPAIQSVATQVAQKCGGLPVFIITVARALENKILPIWKNALKSLQKFDEKGDLTQRAYVGIEWSYMQLSDQELKSLFLLCGTTVQGNYISLTNLLRYSIGLGFFEDHTVEEALNALYAKVDKLKSSCLLLEGDDNTEVRMHDLVHDVAKRIALRDEHVLVEDGGPELKKWPKEDFFNECTKISLLCCNIATLPEVPWECPKLEMFHLHNKKQEMFHLHNKDEDYDMPSNFFEEMKKLKVLALNNLPLISLPPSLKCLENLQTLCLDGCQFEDIALVGELRNLQILSIVKSKVKQLPKEIEQLTRLRLLDLSDCDRLKVISPGVISNLTSLEELRMRNSFVKWQGTKGVFLDTSNNASLSELKKLSKLTALEIRIPDADTLPPDLFSDNLLERYQIFIGGWDRMYETTLNTLKLEFTSRNQLDQGLKMLLKKCDVLSLNGRDYRFPKEVMFNYLTTLRVYRCDGLKCLFSSSVARNFKKLKHLEVSGCKMMEQIISTTKQDEEHYMFGELKSLRLEGLPNLARFCTGKSIEFPLLEKLYIEKCIELGAFVGGPMTKSSRKEETSLFDEKVRFPRLEMMHLYAFRSQTIWQGQLAQGSFGRLRKVKLSHCDSLRSIFPPSMMGRLNALETLDISVCKSVEVVFDERGETNVNETHGTSDPQLKDGQNLILVDIGYCPSLKYIFSASMATRCLQQLQKLEVKHCDAMETIVAKEEGRLESTTPHPNFVFPKVKSLKFLRMSTLKSFYPGLHASEWPLLKDMTIQFCHKVELLVAEISIIQERQYAQTNQPFFLINQEVIFNYLTTLSVSHCDGLKCLFSSSVARNFKKLKHLSISDCKIMEQIVSTTKQDEEHNMFGELKSLRPVELPNLARFCTGKSIEFPLLEELDIGECIKLGAFVGGPMTKSSRKEETSLFDEKVIFPRLEIMHLAYSLRSQTIWQGQLAQGSFGRLRKVSVLACNSLRSIFPPSMMGRLNALETLEIAHCESVEVVFNERGETNVNETHGTSDPQLKDGQNLISVDIVHCPSLKYIFSTSMATRCLQQLQKLDVIHCHAMETIVAKEEGRLESTTPHPNFVSPKVKFLRFLYLSTLRSFYPGLHASEWPLLKDMTIQFCHKVELLVAELSIIQERQYAQTNQPFFLINQDSFPVLEELEVSTTEILYSQSPAESIFSKLKSIRFNGCAPFSKPAVVHFLQKLHNLESLKVDGCQSEEIFGEYSIAVGPLPSVRNLDLSDMDNLMHLGKEKYSQRIFPNLEFLRVWHCDGLKNLESSAISFQNLTALEVYNCNGLECLIPYSIAKCLVHLRKMKVRYCKSIVVIVASNGDDDAGKNEIAFSRLQHLTLETLPSLQGLSSVNCIAKLPLSITLDVTNCPIKLKISPDGVPIPEGLKITEEVAK